MLISAKWVLPINSQPIENGAIVVENGTIRAVGKADTLKKKYSKHSYMDMGLAAIMPGLVDCHTHLEYSVFRGVCDDLPFGLWKIQQQEKSNLLTKKNWLTSAQLGAQEALRSGITTIADVTDSGASLDAALEAGLRGVVFYEITGLKYDKKVLVKAHKDISAWQKKASGSLIDIGISAHAAYTTAPALLKEVSVLAAEKNILSCIHVSGSQDEYQFVKYGSGPLAHRFKELSGWQEVLWQPMGTSPVKYLAQWDVFKRPTIAIHCIHVDEQDLDILSSSGAKVVHCPSCAAKLGMGIAPLRKLNQRKLQLGLGTDSPASNNTMDLFSEMRLGLLLQRAYNQSTNGLAAADFVRVATLGGAEVLGLEKDIGSLEEGKKADIIMVDLSQSYQLPAPDPYSAIVYTCSGADVLLTMVAGEVLFQKGEGEQLDNKLYDEINALRKKLANGKGISNKS